MDSRAEKQPHGYILSRIYEAIARLAPRADVFVREQGFTRYITGTQTLFKVVGVSDLALWQARGEVFHEIPPTRVKKFLTGNGGATKEEVAQALPPLVGDIEYASDDSSDAVAIGIAWLMEQNENR